MDYIFYQAAAINGFDAVGHYLRAGLLVNQCATYAQCAGRAAARRTSRSRRVRLGRDGRARQRVDAPATTRCCARRRSRSPGRSARRSRRPSGASGQASRSPSAEADGKAQAQREQGRAGRAAGVRADGRARRAGRPPRRRRPRRGRAAAAGRPAAPTATAAPADTARRRRRRTPADALLDYLFGKDGAG